MGWKQWFIFGSYVQPNNQPTVHQVDQSLAQFPEETETLLVRDINAWLAQPRDQHKENLSTTIANQFWRARRCISSRSNATGERGMYM